MITRDDFWDVIGLFLGVMAGTCFGLYIAKCPDPAATWTGYQEEFTSQTCQQFDGFRRCKVPLEGVGLTVQWDIPDPKP